jgi:hypothetical protein
MAPVLFRSQQKSVDVPWVHKIEERAIYGCNPLQELGG